MKRLLIAAVLIALASSAFAQEAMKVFKPDTLTWKDNPMFPKGAQTVLLVGDPTKAGVFILRTKFPRNYQVPPHTHPFSEVVTVITGSLGNGMGEKFDAQTGEMLKAGSIFALPAKHAHYVWTTDEETIVQVQATGPWGIDYINPAGDPRKKTK
jgi:quercetin dioxygenase-like cupin family protein